MGFTEATISPDGFDEFTGRYTAYLDEPVLRAAVDQSAVGTEGRAHDKSSSTGTGTDWSISTDSITAWDRRGQVQRSHERDAVGYRLVLLLCNTVTSQPMAVALR